jgi:hypothetical protein
VTFLALKLAFGGDGGPLDDVQIAAGLDDLPLQFVQPGRQPGLPGLNLFTPVRTGGQFGFDGGQCSSRLLGGVGGALVFRASDRLSPAARALLVLGAVLGIGPGSGLGV